MSRVSRNITWALLGNVMSPLAGFFSAPILAHSLGADGRGEVAAATAPLLLCASALTLGLPEATTYVTAGRRRSSGSHFAKSAILIFAFGILGVIALYALAPVLSAGRSELTSLIRLASLALPPALLLALIRGLAAGHGAWRLVTVERCLNAFSRLIALLVLSLNSAVTPESATIVIAASSFVGMIAYAALPFMNQAKRALPLNEGDETRILHYGIRVWFGSLAGILLTRVDQVLLVPLSNTYELGLYAVAVSIAEVVLIFNAAVRDVMFSAESEDPSSSRLSQMTRISTMLTGILAICVGAACVPGTAWLFGQDFQAAVPVILVLLVAIYMGNPGSVAGAGLSARGRPGLRSLSLAIAVAINVLLLIVLVPSLGAVGAALATLVGNIVAGYLNIVWLRIYFGIPIRHFFGIRRADLRALTSQITSRLKPRESATSR